jgi:hypothetical protein
MTTLPISCAVVMKSGNFNFLEPSVPLQECNGIALPLIDNISNKFDTREKLISIYKPDMLP